MSNRGRITRECELLNRKRNVFEGIIDNRSFFQNIRGDLLVSGERAGDQEMILNLVESCMEKADMPIILLSGHLGVFTELQRRRTQDAFSNVRIASPSEKTYHPFLGMSKQQIQRFVSLAAEKMGIGVLIGKVMIYTAALLDIVAAKYPVSLPAMAGLLQEDDDVISEVAMECGLSNVVVDNIRSNHEAGIVLRRICGKLEEVFEEVYTPVSDTGYSFATGIRDHGRLFAFYTASRDYQILNTCLKEELYNCLKQGTRLRVILDEMIFENEEDELLRYLLREKMQGTDRADVSGTESGEMAPGGSRSGICQCCDVSTADTCCYRSGVRTIIQYLSVLFSGTDGRHTAASAFYLSKSSQLADPVRTASACAK